MARPKKNTKHPGGRPTVFNTETLQKLEHGFKIGLTDVECCAYADIKVSTFYEWQKRNPDFLYKKEQWKKMPIAKAKHTIYKNLDDAKTAQWYLERKCKDEFSTQSKLELESKGINIVVADDEHKKMLEDL